MNETYLECHVGGIKDRKVCQSEMAGLGAAADIHLYFISKGVSVAKYISDITH